MRSSRGERVTVALALGVLALLAQRGLAPLLASHVYAQPLPGNDSLLHVWAIAWGQHALATQPLHPFDANIFHPHEGTALFTDHLLGLSALLAPLRLLTDDVVLVHNVALLLAPCLNGLVFYWLLRDLAVAPVAAFAGACVYAFAPLRLFADRLQIQMLVAWWLPLVLLSARRWLAGGRRGWLATLCAALTLQGLTGIYLMAYFAPVLLLMHVFWLREHPLRRAPGRWLGLLAAQAVAALLLLPSALAYRRVQAALGTERSPVVNGLLSLAPENLPDYLPLGSLALLCGACLLGWRRLDPAERRRTLPFVLIAFGAMLLGFGPSLPVPGGSVRGPYAALMALPGFDALRAPGRMLHVALIGLAVMAAAGVTVLARRLPARPFAAVLGGIAGLLLLECRTPLFALLPAPPPPLIDPVYQWLARQPRPFPFAELPFGISINTEQRYQYASTWHWQPMLNGSMGVVPLVHAYMQARLAEPPTVATLAELQALGLDHLVVHPRAYPAPVRGRWQALAAARPEALVRRYETPRSIVYGIGEVTAAPLRLGEALARNTWRVTASEDAAAAGRAVDADPRSSWRSWGDLERRLRRWWAPRTFPADWRAFLARQPSRFTLDLGTSVPLGAVVLRLGHSDPDALGLLRIAVSDDGEQWREVRTRVRAPDGVRSLVAAGADARLAFLLPPGISGRWLRLSAHGIDWEVADLEVQRPAMPGRGAARSPGRRGAPSRLAFRGRT